MMGALRARSQYRCFSLREKVASSFQNCLKHILICSQSSFKHLADEVLFFPASLSETDVLASFCRVSLRSARQPKRCALARQGAPALAGASPWGFGTIPRASPSIACSR